MKIPNQNFTILLAEDDNATTAFFKAALAGSKLNYMLVRASTNFDFYKHLEFTYLNRPVIHIFVAGANVFVNVPFDIQTFSQMTQLIVVTSWQHKVLEINNNFILKIVIVF